MYRCIPPVPILGANLKTKLGVWIQCQRIKIVLYERYNESFSQILNWCFNSSELLSEDFCIYARTRQAKCVKSTSEN